VGLDAIAARIAILAGRLRGMLAEVPGVIVRDLGAQPCGIVTFTKANEGADALKARLGERRMNVSVSRRSSTLLDFAARGIPDVVR
ncbi:aminotransferase, partial [Acinetobacter baumannii]